MPPPCWMTVSPSQVPGLPAVAVLDRLAVREHVRRRGPLERLRPQQLPGVESRVPLGEVVHRRDDRPRRVRLGHADPVGVLPGVALLLIAAGPARDDAGAVVERGLRHADDVEDALLQEGFVAHPARLLDDGAQQEVARVVVLVALAGGEVHGLALEVVDQLRDLVVLADVGEEVRHVGVALDPGGVGQQVLDRDRLAAGRVVGQELRDRVRDRELAFLDEHQEGDRRELLRHRADAEHHVRLDRYAQFEVRHAVGRAAEDLALPGHDDGHAGFAGLGRGAEQLVDCRRGLGGRHAGGRAEQKTESR